MPSALLPYAYLTQAAYFNAETDPDGKKFDAALAQGGLRLLTKLHATTEGLDTNGYIAATLDPLDACPFLVIAFQGSCSLKNWLTDATIKLAACSFLTGSIHVHAGFDGAYGIVRDSVWSVVTPFMEKYPNATIIVLGHSLGAALATLCAVNLADKGCPVRVRTFGSPRVGTWKFMRHYHKLIPDSIRAVHDQDVVCKIPIGPYRHVRQEFHFTDDGKVYGRVRCWFRWLLRFNREVVELLNGTAFNDHGIEKYINALSKIP